MRSCANCNHQVRYSLYTPIRGYTDKVECRYGLPQGQIDCDKYELDVDRPSLDTVTVPRELINDIHLLLTNSSKLYEEYRHDDIEELHNNIKKYL